VLRGTEYPRGPATLTDGEGRFRLAGLAAEEGVRVFHPALRVEAGHVIERVAEDVPLDLIWTLEGIGRAEAYGTLVIRARDGKGGGVEDLHLLVLGADGQGQDVVTNGEGEAIVDLPSARCRIRGDSPFDAFDVVEASVVVPAEGEVILDLVLSPRPRLRIVGDIPADLVPVLVAAGREHGMAETAEDGDAPPPLWLSTEARAVVCLRNFEQGWAYFVPVGPTIDGVRTATLDVPAPHRVRLAEDDALDGAYAVLAPRANPRDERLVEIEDGVISLRCGGRFALTVDLEDGTPARLVDVGLPPLAAGAVERRIDLERDGAPDTKSGEARLVITRADGKAMGELMVSSGRVGAGWRGARGRQEAPVEVWAPCRVLLTAPGLHPLQVDVKQPGEHALVFPAGGIDVRTTDAAGAPVASALLVNGVLHDAPEGRLMLRGFAAGPHAVVVQRTSWPPTVTEGVHWRFTLAEGEVRAKTLILP
jgi:hypothetical protein